MAPINRVLNRFMAEDVELEQSDRRPEAEACHLPLTHADYPHRGSARVLTESAPLRARLTARGGGDHRDERPASGPPPFRD